MILRTARDVSMLMIYISAMDHTMLWNLKFSHYVQLPSIKKNVSISLRLSDFVQCRRGYYFRAWVLYFSFGKYLDMNIKHLCSSSLHKHNL